MKNLTKTVEAAEGGSQTLARGLAALTMIGEAYPPLTVVELAAELGIHRSMAYRLVKTLEQFRFVERLPSGALELGPRLTSLGRGVAPSLQAAAAPQLASLADELDMTTFIVVYDGEDAVTLSSAEPRHAHATVAQRPGSRHSVDRGAPGRVIRSQLFPGEYPPKRFERSHDEVLAGLSSLAVPLPLAQGGPAALSVIYLPRAMDEEIVVSKLELAAARIASALR
jgi:DNA-binding IclR family transcriptional regulator